MTWQQLEAIRDDEVVRCVLPDVTQEMVKEIEAAQKDGDTVGGTFEVVAMGVPVGLGSHTGWDTRLDGRLAQAVMCVNAVKAVEIGRGVRIAYTRGSQAHDEIAYDNQQRRFYHLSNRAGGIEGGITNGEEVRVVGREAAAAQRVEEHRRLHGVSQLGKGVVILSNQDSTDFAQALHEGRRKATVSYGTSWGVHVRPEAVTGLSDVLAAGGVDLAQARADTTPVSTLAEIGLNAGYQVTDWFSLHAGYRFIWIQNVAFAPDQLDLSNSAPGTKVINAHNHLFLHGVNVGAEIRW